jgi:hypothetical protein
VTAAEGASQGIPFLFFYGFPLPSSFLQIIYKTKKRLMLLRKGLPEGGCGAAGWFGLRDGGCRCCVLRRWFI